MSTYTSSLCRGVRQKRKGRKGDRKEKMRRKKNKREQERGREASMQVSVLEGKMNSRGEML